ncbi:hypothetical protein P43SY_008039 [Pythium insidiosum]|uniref:Methyltransferase-domain-containing protein n=1 Tax=Pythium insidiosum TaxID=114742 RepID=A0AAD5LQV1_PYTIN|nr:hypothetical protein P43SY_008039 [Pythium insidiosum]
MSCSSSEASAGTVATKTLRFDIQNLPQEFTPPGSIVLRIPATSTIRDVYDAVHRRLSQILRRDDGALEDAGYGEVTFDMEVYNARQDTFEPLTSEPQLSRRSRLNIVLTSTQSVGSCLALPARLFDVDTLRGGFKINDRTVVVGEVENSGLGTGLTTWDGSVVLAKYLEHQHSSSLQGKRVLEVGAGTGVVGISAALLGAEDVILTDLEYALTNLQRNIDLTRAAAESSAKPLTGKLSAQVLDWFHPRTDFGALDYILASDVVWVEELISPLVNTLHRLAQASSGVQTCILLSHQQRSRASDAILFRLLDAHGFLRRKVPTEDLHPDFRSDRISIYEITLGGPPEAIKTSP